MPASDAPGDRAGTAADSGDGRRLELYVRDRYPAAVDDTIRLLLQRCSRLQSTGVVDSYRIKRWPPRVGSADVADGQPRRRDLVAEFREWAAEHGYGLEPAFSAQTVTSSMVERDVQYEYTEVPLFALALYEDDELRGVAPCSDGDRTYTVDDGLTALEREQCGAFPEAPPRGAAATTAEVGRE